MNLLESDQQEGRHKIGTVKERRRKIYGKFLPVGGLRNFTKLGNFPGGLRKSG